MNTVLVGAQWDDEGKGADQPPVILTFEPDAYDASIREPAYIRWNLSAPVDALKLVIDDIPVFIGDGSMGNGRWLDVSGLKLVGCDERGHRSSCAWQAGLLHS